MQMIFRKPVAIGPAVRPQARRGTFALEPVTALTRLSDRVSALAERSLEPNPFFLPQFLEPALQALGTKSLRLAVYSDREDIRFFAPVVASTGGMFGRRRFSVWTHPYAPLGTPLVDREAAPAVAADLIRHMRTTRRTLFALPNLPLEGETAELMRHAAGRRGYWTVAERQMRPILHIGAGSGAADFDGMVSQKRRRELDRQLRRLCETGAVSLMSARAGSEIETAFQMFAALEAGGWKGRRGTAIARKNAVHEFARAAVMQLAQIGHAAIDVMRVGDRPIAALIRLETGGLSIPWKIAFDEEYAAFSPGKQLMCDETRRWLADGSVARVDPVCEQDNPLMASLWPEREPYGTLLVSAERWGLSARMAAGMAEAKGAAKRSLKSLLRRGKSGGKQPAKPAAAPPPKPTAKQPAKPKAKPAPTAAGPKRPRQKPVGRST